MMGRVWATLAICAGLMVGAIPIEPAEAQSRYITIRVCNRSYDPANVAVSYQPVGSGQFYNEGWYTVPAGQCRDIARTDNAYFYAYAEVLNDGTRYWSGNHGLCVIYPGPYAFWSDNSNYCSRGQELRDFVTMHANDWGPFTWNLDPPR